MGQVVNQTLMAELAVKFNTGADILGKGKRVIDSKLGAANMSGDTVSVTITDSGEVYEGTLNLDDVGEVGSFGVSRGSVPVKVSPIGIAAEASAGDLTLAIKRDEILGKRIANIQTAVNKRAFRALLGASQAFVAKSGLDVGMLRNTEYRQAIFDAQAYTEMSKYSGETYGICGPQTWNRIAMSLMKDFGANANLGSKLYGNEIGDFLGFRWTKCMEHMLVKGKSLSLSATLDAYGQLTVASSALANTGDVYEGKIYPIPFMVNFTDDNDADDSYVKTVDALGNETGIIKTVFLQMHITNRRTKAYEWHLAQPLFLEGPRKNGHFDGYTAAKSRAFGFVTGSTAITGVTGSGKDLEGHQWDDHEWYPNQDWNRAFASSGAAVALTGVLEDGVTYFAPMVMWKDPDFIIAVKGIEELGKDSFTIPTQYGERGIVPWRGTYDSDARNSINLFRVDGLMGMTAYQGVSMASVYIPMDSAVGPVPPTPPDPDPDDDDT